MQLECILRQYTKKTEQISREQEKTRHGTLPRNFKRETEVSQSDHNVVKGGDPTI